MNSNRIAHKLTFGGGKKLKNNLLSLLFMIEIDFLLYFELK